MDTVVHDPFRDAITAATGRTLEEVLARKDPGPWLRFERGELTEEQYFQSYAPLGLDVEIFQRVRRAGYAFLPGMEPILHDLTGAVVRAAATNYPIWVDELATGLLAGCFDVFVSSHRLGVRKPDPRFFERLCAIVGAPPGDVLLVDDRLANVEGARVAGLQGHLFTSAQELRQRLEADGVLSA